MNRRLKKRRGRGERMENKEKKNGIVLGRQRGLGKGL